MEAELDPKPRIASPAAGVVAWAATKVVDRVKERNPLAEERVDPYPVRDRVYPVHPVSEPIDRVKESVPRPVPGEVPDRIADSPVPYSVPVPFVDPIDQLELIRTHPQPFEQLEQGVTAEKRAWEAGADRY